MLKDAKGWGTTDSKIKEEYTEELQSRDVNIKSILHFPYLQEPLTFKKILKISNI